MPRLGHRAAPHPAPSPPSVYVRSAVHPRAVGQGRSPPLPPPPRPHSKPILRPTAQCCRDFGPWGVGWGLGERGRAETPGADAQGGRGSLRGKGKPGPGPQPRASVPLQGCGRRTPQAHRPEPQHGRSPLADGKLRLRGGGTYSQARGSAKIRIPGLLPPGPSRALPAPRYEPHPGEAPPCLTAATLTTSSFTTSPWPLSQAQDQLSTALPLPGQDCFGDTRPPSPGLTCPDRGWGLQRRGGSS